MSNRLYNQFSYSPERQPISLMGKFIQSAALNTAALTNQGISYTAVLPGSAGNVITITLIDPVADGSLAISVVGNAISVTLAQASGVITTTQDALVAALNGNAPASALIATTGGGSSPMAGLATTHLSGGSDGSMTTNAMNMSMTNTAVGLYVIQLQDEFPEILSAQVTPLGEAPGTLFIQSADTAFGTSKTVVINTSNNLSVGDGIFVHLIFRNSSN